MRSRTYFLSDLHLFCRRFDGERFWEQGLQAARQANTFVLGGDIFDFRWTTMATIAETADEAIRRLETLVATNRQCEFHFLLGNHDHHEAFLARLELLAENEPNLSWHPDYLRLRTSFFLHGDVADGRTGPRRLKKRRGRCPRTRRKGRISNWLYDLAVDARLHQVAYHVVNPKRVVARRLLTYLERIGHGPTSGVEDVYSGHTHLALSGFEYDGVRFHNCGAPVKGCAFRILEDVVPDR